MATGQMGDLIEHLRRAVLPQEGAQRTDGQLLHDYVSRREEAALAALVGRHGPMVWGVCRRLLRNLHDAEDAFQATFLVLVRKAASIAWRNLVGNWLYGVAYQTAMKARATAARRKGRERQVTPMPEAEAARQDRWPELQPLLDHELSRLPDKYRIPIVLCDLEGRTRKAAARQLGCPEGTVAGRLARARALLAKRLARHGLPISAAALAAVLAQNAASAAVPVAVAAVAIRAAAGYAAGQVAAGGALSAGAVALAEGVLRGLLLAKLRLPAVVLVVLATLGAGAAVLARQGPAEGPADTRAADKSAGAPAREAGDPWPQWRGPNRDGVVRGITAPAKWPGALKEEWKVPVGEGVASPVVAGGKVYVFTRQDFAARQKVEEGVEVVRCLDQRTGKELWRSEPYRVAFKPWVDGNFPWPRSTPTVAGGRVFTLGITEVLSCFDAGTGKLLWRKEGKPLPSDPAAGRGHRYGGASPLVFDGLCVVAMSRLGGDRTGGVRALDVATGDVKWWHRDENIPACGSPILVDLAGERQVVCFGEFGKLLGLSAATGKKLWELGGGGTAGLFGGYDTPLRYKDLLLFADTDGSPRAIRLERGPKGITPKDVWSERRLPLYYNSPVLAGNLLFGMSTRKQGCFFCLDAGSGKRLWESDGRQGAYASVLNAGSVLLFLTERGRLRVVRPSATAYEPVAEYRVSDTDTHAHPVFLGDHILVKDGTTLRSFRIEPGAATE
jgi:RNA polymerase sigma factor (sigma-70 family)